MSFTYRALSIACLMGLATTPLSRVGLAAGTDAVPSPAAGLRSPGAMPVLEEHGYRMLARVRPLLFWISKDDVGAGRISWRGDDDGAFGLDLLIGSDPQRAPRRINRWGYISEHVRGSDARVVGVMKQSNEQSIAEAERQLGQEAGQGGYVFRAIRGTADQREAHASVTTIRVARDLTFRELDPLLALVSAAGHDGETRSVPLPNGTRPGFLLALRDLIRQSTDTHRQHPSVSSTPPRAPIPYVYFGVFYDLTMRSSELLRTATIDGRRYTNVARSDFEVRNRSTGHVTRFQLTYGTDGSLAGIPVHAVYRPRWWFEVQLFLDEPTAFQR